MTKAVDTTGWISCAEQLPPLQQTVQVLYAETGETDEARRYKFMASEETDWATWKGLGDPTHWRPRG